MIDGLGLNFLVSGSKLERSVVVEVVANFEHARVSSRRNDQFLVFEEFLVCVLLEQGILVDCNELWLKSFVQLGSD